MTNAEKYLLWNVLLMILWHLVRLPGQRPEDTPLCAEIQNEIKRLRGTL